MDGAFAPATRVLPDGDDRRSGLCPRLFDIHSWHMVSAWRLVVLPTNHHDENYTGHAGIGTAHCLCDLGREIGDGSSSEARAHIYLVRLGGVPDDRNCERAQYRRSPHPASLCLGRCGCRSNGRCACTSFARLDVGMHGADRGTHRLRAQRFSQLYRLCQRGLGWSAQHAQVPERLKRRLGPATLPGEGVGRPTS